MITTLDLDFGFDLGNTTQQKIVMVTRALCLLLFLFCIAFFRVEKSAAQATCAEILSSYRPHLIATFKVSGRFLRSGPMTSSRGRDSFASVSFWREKNLIVAYSPQREMVDFFNVRTGSLDRRQPVKLAGIKSYYDDGAGPVYHAFLNQDGTRFYGFGPDLKLFTAAIDEIYRGQELQQIYDFSKFHLDIESPAIESVRLSVDEKRLFLHVRSRPYGLDDPVFSKQRAIGIFDLQKGEWLVFSKVSAPLEGPGMVVSQMSADGQKLLTRLTVQASAAAQSFFPEVFEDSNANGIDANRDFPNMLYILSSGRHYPLVYPTGSRSFFNTYPHVELSHDGTRVFSYYDGEFVSFDPLTGELEALFPYDHKFYYVTGFSPDGSALFIASRNNLDDSPKLLSHDLSREGAPRIEGFELPVNAFQPAMSAEGRWLIVNDQSLLKLFDFESSHGPAS